TLETKPPVTIAPPPPNLDLEMAKRDMRNGAQRFFAGDYDRAIVSLSNSVEEDPQNATGYFLLGCSYASRYLLSGLKNQEDFNNASEAFQNLKRVAPKYRIKDRSFFSPAIMEMYNKMS